jgi:hypothetical protein
MAMLTLNGLVLNVFDTPEKVDKKTGETYAAATRVQVQAENILENGQKRIELVTLKVQKGEAYKALIGKPVRVPVGAFASGGAVVYYALSESPL